jgi:hypothetical protein
VGLVAVVAGGRLGLRLFVVQHALHEVAAHAQVVRVGLVGCGPAVLLPHLVRVPALLCGPAVALQLLQLLHGGLCCVEVRLQAGVSGWQQGVGIEVDGEGVVVCCVVALLVAIACVGLLVALDPLEAHGDAGLDVTQEDLDACRGDTAGKQTHSTGHAGTSF